MKHSFIAIIFLLILSAVSGCSDGPLYTNDFGSSLDRVGDTRISTFSLSNETMCAEESLKSVTVVLTPTNGFSMQFLTEVEVVKSTMKCHVRIPLYESIPDGEYLLTVRLADGTGLGGSFLAIFKNEMLHSIQAEMMEYTKLNGSGTKDDPYIIKSTDDFKSLISNLRRDSVSHGSGRYFRQTATFNAPTQSELYDGRGYFNYGFAGVYDGGGFAIENLYYLGNSNADKDSGVGLFSELYDGAEISNLTINNISIQNAYQDCGAIAGKASGNIKITRVKVNGNILNSGYRCGGLIGSFKGTLSLDNYDFNVSISGKSEVGGIIGQAYGFSKVTIHKVTTNDHRFTVSGTDNVGGLIGRIYGEFHICRVELKHTVSGEDSDLRVISSTGVNEGGIIGQVEYTDKINSLDSILIECPIGGGTEAVGGIIGHLKSTSPVTVNYCQMTSIVSGTNKVGGLFGYCDITNSQIQFTGKDNLTKVTAADNAAAKISGKSDVGGLFGYLNGTAAFYTKVRIAINVSATTSNVGGAVGNLSNSSFPVNNLVFDSNTMRVDGSGDCTGGVIGYAGHSTISGDHSNSVGFGGSIPGPAKFTPTFRGLVYGKNKTGGLIGKIYDCNVQDLSAECTVTGSGDYVGGLIGYVEFNPDVVRNIQSCTFGVNGKVTGSGEATGGLFGYVVNTGNLTNNINYGSVNGKNATGGIFGYVNYSSSSPMISYCINTGDVNSNGTSTGGVIGYMIGRDQYMQVEECANYGSVTSTGGGGSSGLGGIVGFCPGKKIRIWYCANHGSVKGSGQQHGVGGVAGSLGEDPTGAYASTNLELGWCCNYGEINSSYSNLNIGGILGYQEEGCIDKGDHDSWLHDCVNYGNITSSQNEDNGGILGKADHYSYVQNCVNFGKVTKGNGTVGTHKSACQWYHDNLYHMEGSGKSWCSNGTITESNRTDTLSYGGFDFTKTWIIENGYPVLRKNVFQTVKYP